MAKNSSIFDFSDSDALPPFTMTINEIKLEKSEEVEKNDSKINLEEKEELQETFSKGKPNTGRWTEEEHKKFLKAIEIYGKSWNKVQSFIGTRTATQTRSHAQKYFNKISTSNNTNDLNEDKNQLFNTPKKRESKVKNKISKLNEINKKQELSINEGNENTKILIPLFDLTNQNIIPTSNIENYNLGHDIQAREESNLYNPSKIEEEFYEEISLEINNLYPSNPLIFPYENDLPVGIE